MLCEIGITQHDAVAELSGAGRSDPALWDKPHARVIRTTRNVYSIVYSGVDSSGSVESALTEIDYPHQAYSIYQKIPANLGSPLSSEIEALSSRNSATR